MTDIRSVYSKSNKNENEQKVADLKPLLDRCAEDVGKILGKRVSVKYSIEVESSLLKIDQILDIVCGATGVKKELVLSQVKIREVVTVRHLVCYFANKVYKYSLNEVGAVLGRDHTSVIVGRNKVAAFLEINDEYVVSLFSKCQIAINEAEAKP
jgi:chromosomal replication initiation ATPase DnaA